MRILAALAFLLLAVPGTASAAPPANDNRADAAAIPSFPASIAGTTVEATVERLDPQVSRCGRVEATSWYRVDIAPDGLIAITVKGAAGVAPVVRVYRRGASAIQEADCGSAGPGGSASASIEAVRGSNYLVLVGRRPGTPDGAFELSAQLFLPPANDSRGGASPLRLPGSTRGSTLGATGDEADPGCGIRGGTVWYRMTSRREGRVLLRLSAQGDLDAAVAVLERVRSRLRGIGCAQTDRQGRATVAFGARRGGSYLIVVGHVQNADPGTFRLDTLLSEAAESRAAGARLARTGVRSTVHGLTDVNDVWRVSMRPGVTYRIGFSSSPCATVTLRPRRSLGRELARLTCDQYTTFTPGPDGSLEYILEVVAGNAPVVQGYRLGLAAAGPDDLGVGVALRNRAPARGSLTPGQLDVRDVFHFDVEQRSDVRLAVSGGLRFVLVRDDGVRLAESSSFRRQLGPGRYVVAVTTAFGGASVRYTLALLIREITSTSLRLDAATVEPGTAVSLRPVVTNASAGFVTIQIDRFDPLTGWQFNRLLRVRVGTAASWRPPAEGRWRFRATFRGTIDASPSRSGYVLLLVERKL
jgi:hypothetical protein